MKLSQLLICCITIVSLLFASVPLYSEWEYVFTEQELELFLEEQIEEAVHRVSAELIKEQEIQKVEYEFKLQHVEDQLAQYSASYNSHKQRLPYIIGTTAVGFFITGFLVARGVFK